MPYRILHIADIHLDAAFAGGDAELGSRRREEMRDAFERALRLARERRVDAVCIAGDLYEDGRAGGDRAAYLHRVLGELAPIRVFVSPGNHDPHTSASIYERIARWPENVTIFTRRRFARASLADGITLWGFGHEHALDRDPAITDFRCDGPGTHLLLFHGSDREHMPEGKDAIAPFTDADVERTGAQHAMVGHFHGLLHGRRYAYPGSPEPLTIAQDGRHTASLVTVEDGSVSMEFIDINRVRYADFAFDISAFGDRAALADALSARLSEEAGGDGITYSRAKLVGLAQVSIDLDVGALETQLGTRFPGLRIVDDSAAFDDEAVRREGLTVRSEFVRTMRERIAAAEPAERAALQEALHYGMLAFARKTIHA